MNKEQILEAIRQLAKSQGMYSRLYARLLEDDELREDFLAGLEANGFKDVVDLVLYLES